MVTGTLNTAPNKLTCPAQMNGPKLSVPSKAADPKSALLWKVADPNQVLSWKVTESNPARLWKVGDSNRVSPSKQAKGIALVETAAKTAFTGK
ncbi:hypothetical protein ACICHK_39625 [Streptomyces sp. AHU1]|uniref:hypothetical protein n=1 Tax=Streptomyces sp. AHU1 TaxID=3377215 RepID=UPI003877C428